MAEVFDILNIVSVECRSTLVFGNSAFTLFYTTIENYGLSLLDNDHPHYFNPIGLS